MARLADALERARRSAPRLELTVCVAERAAIAVGVATGELDAGLADWAPHAELGCTRIASHSPQPR